MTIMLNIFSGAFWLFVSSIKNTHYIFCQFLKPKCLVFLLLSCMDALYVLNTSPSLVMCFANIFFRLMVCLFIFFKAYFDEQKFVILIKSTASVFPLMAIASVLCLKNLAYAQVLYFPHTSIFNCVITLACFTSFLSQGNCWAAHVCLAFLITTVPLLPTPQTAAVDQLGKQAGRLWTHSGDLFGALSGLVPG